MIFKLGIHREVCQVTVRRIAWVRYTSTTVKIEKEVKKVTARWFYATDVPTTKPFNTDYKLVKHPSKFLPFNVEDSTRLEESFIKLQQNKELNAGKSTKLQHSLQLVSVNEDGLFNVDLVNRILKPTYWPGPTYEVRRGIWFKANNEPLPDLLSEQIEHYYHKYRPDYFFEENIRKNEEYELPGIKLKSEKELYMEKYKNDPTRNQWPYTEFDDLSEVNKILHFKTDQEAILINEGQLLPHKLISNFGSSNSIFGLYSIKRGYDEGSNLEAESQNNNSNPSKSISNNKSLKEAVETVGQEKVKATGDGELFRNPAKFLSETNKKFQTFMENDFSNDSIETDNRVDREVDHLILCVHGIGQSLSSKYSSVNFAHDCNNMRQIIKTEYIKGRKDGDNNCKIQILPIIWRYDIDFGLEYTYEDFDSKGEYRLPKLADLNVDGVTSVRNLAADVLMDVLLYYDTKYNKEILDSVIKIANRIYDKYLEHHPDFKGKVSILGHSLGSAIVLDILSREPGPGQAPPQEKGGKDISSVNFKFPVENFFALGSPNGVFKFIRGHNIHPLSEKEGDARFQGKAVYPHVRNYYNLFYATDVVAYRIEPLIHPSMKQVPPYKWENRNDTIFPKFTQDSTKADATKAVPEHVRGMLRRLNDQYARVDILLPQGVFDLDILSAGMGLGAHIQYWEDVNVGRFLLQSILRDGHNQHKTPANAIEGRP